MLIEGLHSPTWYSYYTMDDPGLTNDKHNSIIGVGQFRQHRVVYDSCHVPAAMRYLNVTCIPIFEDAPENRNFSKKWILNGTIRDRLDNIWKHVDSNFDKSDNHEGKTIFTYIFMIIVLRHN